MSEQRTITRKVYTKDSLVECKQQIDAGSSRDVSVFDLDSGREYRVVSCSPRGSSSSRAAECAVFSTSSVRQPAACILRGAANGSVA